MPSFPAFGMVKHLVVRSPNLDLLQLGKKSLAPVSVLNGIIMTTCNFWVACFGRTTDGAKEKHIGRI
jgi:hypothetical protein